MSRIMSIVRNGASASSAAGVVACAKPTHHGDSGRAHRQVQNIFTGASALILFQKAKEK